MGRARVVAPPPQDHIPEPLVNPVIVEQEIPVETLVIEESVSGDSIWEDGNYEEEPVIEPSPEELEQERLAQEKYEELQQRKFDEELRVKEAEEMLAKAKEIVENPPVVIETVVETVIETVHVTDPNLVEQLELLKAANEKLARENEAVAKAKEEQILKMRQKATETRSSQIQLNMLQIRKPSLLSKIKNFFKQRRIKTATNPLHANYEMAIIHQASIAVPKMLDEMEKMHENLVILEELLEKYKERQKITGSEKHPRH